MDLFRCSTQQLIEQDYNAGKSIDECRAPEELNDETIEMPFYRYFTEKNLRLQFGVKDAIIPESQWKYGWEKTWMQSFSKYNHDPKYPQNVLNNAKYFYPQ